MSPTNSLHTRRREIQLCYPFSESRLLNQGRVRSQWQPPYLVQPKLNGERCRALVESSGRTLLFSSSAELITTLPHISQECSSLLPPGEYDGELYVHGWTFSEIHSVVSTVMSQHPSAPEMQLHLFDIIDPTQIQGERIAALTSLFSPLESEILQLVPTHVCFSHEEIMPFYDGCIAEGYEGFVVKEFSSPSIRKRSPYWMKFKPKKTDSYPISSMIEAISQDGKPLGMVGAFWCYDSSGTPFKVGAGKLTHQERTRLWVEGLPLQNSYLLVEYQTLSDSLGVPHFSRAVKIISAEEAYEHEQAN